MHPGDAFRAVGSCPSPEELAAFGLGNLSLEALDVLADHLAHCATCAAAVDALPDKADDLVSALRGLEAPGNSPADAALEREMSALEESGRDATWWADLSPAPGGEPEPRPDQLREYRLLEKFGQGGMGTVYRALHTRLEKVVALKVLAGGRMDSPKAVARFRREMRAVGKLSHPNIIQATDAGEENGTHFLVMEFAEGTDLARLIELHGRLPVADACALVRQAALGLQHAHEHGLIHRDIKPSNLLLTPAGKVKVLDLGLALLQGNGPPGEGSTASSLLLGSFDYMAPEQGDDPHQVDHRADLYALGKNGSGSTPRLLQMQNIRRGTGPAARANGAHRFQQRQRQRHDRAAEEAPPRYRPPCGGEGSRECGAGLHFHRWCFLCRSNYCA
jgi:hypothetical protein